MSSVKITNKNTGQPEKNLTLSKCKSKHMR